jgi:hypothetical protein
MNHCLWSCLLKEESELDMAEFDFSYNEVNLDKLGAEITQLHYFLHCPLRLRFLKNVDVLYYLVP